MSYTINDLRGDLADTIRALKSGDTTMNIEKAKAIGDLAQTMINSAKVEADMLKTIGRQRMQPTGFIPLEHQDTLNEQERGALPPPKATELPAPRKPHVYNAVGTAPRGAI